MGGEKAAAAAAAAAADTSLGIKLNKRGFKVDSFPTSCVGFTGFDFMFCDFWCSLNRLTTLS